MRIDPAIAALISTSGAFLFGIAAVHKLRDLPRFAAAFEAYGLLPVRLQPLLVVFVPLMEAGVAAGLLVPRYHAFAAAIGAALLLAYASAIAINLRQGRSDLRCGCGGPNDQRPIAAWMVWRNVLIALLLPALLLPAGSRQLELTDAVTIGLGSLACALLYACLDRLLGNGVGRAPQLRTGS